MPTLRGCPSLRSPFVFWLCSILLPAFSLSQSVTDKAAPATPSGADLRPVLVELFTSEGCSSCPPADRMVEILDTQQPIAGAQLIVLSEHVTYWDHDGWKDPNSSSVLTDRQAAYENVLGEPSSFTPQIIVDGAKQIRIDQPQQQMEEIFHSAAATPKVPLRIGEVSVDGGDHPVVHAHVEADENTDKRNADVYVAVALNRVESQVLKGENGGKRLVHVAVVQELTKVGKLSKGKNFAQDVQLKLKPGTDPKNMRLVAFVQEPGPGKVVAAAARTPAN